MNFFKLLFLTAMSAAYFAGAQERLTPRQEAFAKMEHLHKGLDMFYVDCGHYPTTEEGLDALTRQPQRGCDSWGPDPYLEEIGRDPWNHPWIYESAGPKSFTLHSLGADGLAGGEGDNADVTLKE